MAPKYHLPEPAAMPIPSLTGRFLAHNQGSRAVRAFYAADLHLGVKPLTKPTMVQSALLARVSTTYGWWAEKRWEERWQIEAGLIPLVPAAAARANGNSTLQPVVPDVGIDDATVVSFVRNVGVARILEAAVAVEAAQ